IGILASVVLASLNTARAKGSDAAIKADLAGVRASAEVEFDTLGNKYSKTGVTIAAACSTLTGATAANTIFENASIQNALAHANTQAGADSDCGVTDIGDAYSIASPLKTANTAWCIDSTGIARSTNAAGTPYDAVIAGGSAVAPAHDVVGSTTCN
ncbi:MAG: hypothetical protein ACREGC_01730, partial [Minisyncoccia bacterium]